MPWLVFAVVTWKKYCYLNCSIVPPATALIDTCTMHSQVPNTFTWFLYASNVLDEWVKHAGGAKVKAVVALLTAIPFGIAAAVILGNAYHSKATNERRWHVAVPLAFAACALFALAFLLK